MARVIALTRVSTMKVSQDESPERQAERAREWATRNGHELIEVVQERVSGGRSVGHRPGLDEVMRRLRRRDARGIWVARLDRLGRDTLGVHLVIRELESLGVHVFVEDVFGGSPYDSKNPAAHYMLTMLAGNAQMAKDSQGRAAVEGKERARLAGKNVARPKEDLPVAQALMLHSWWFKNPGGNWYQAAKWMEQEGYLQPGRIIKRTGVQRQDRPWSQQSLRRSYERWKEKQKGKNDDKDKEGAGHEQRNGASVAQGEAGGAGVGD